MSFNRLALAALAFLILFAAEGSATLIVQDFNDAAAGNLSGQSGIGTGSSAAWAGSSSIDVVAGDLIPDASTNYAITQGGTAQSITHDTLFNASARKSTVDFDTALTGSKIWGSFLVNQNTQSAGRGGIAFNQTSTSAGAGIVNPRLLTLGGDFEAWLASDNEIELPGTVGVDTTLLVLFRIAYDPAGNERTSIWLDPDVTTLGPADAFSVSDWLDPAGITSLSVFSYGGGGVGQGDVTPLVDAVRISDGPTAYQDVTGVVNPIPEPSTLLLGAVFGLAGLATRR